MGRLGKWLGAQAQLGFDDGVGNGATVFHRATQDAPQIGDVLGRAVKHLDHCRPVSLTLSAYGSQANAGFWKFAIKYRAVVAVFTRATGPFDWGEFGAN